MSITFKSNKPTLGSKAGRAKRLEKIAYAQSPEEVAKLWGWEYAELLSFLKDGAVSDQLTVCSAAQAAHDVILYLSKERS